MKTKEQDAASHRRRYAADPEYRKRELYRNKVCQQRDRLAALQAYGGRCACCGEDRPEFLALDHINGGGEAHRRELLANRRGVRLVTWLKQQAYPVGFRVLCHNCNCSLGFFGYCPHVEGTRYLKDLL